MLRSIVVLLDRLGSHRDAAVLEGAVVETAAGHRIFGEDERQLREVGARLRDALGDELYEAAHAEGALLDGDAAAERALAALGRMARRGHTEPAAKRLDPRPLRMDDPPTARGATVRSSP
jgi:hypothetical protein